MIDYVMYAISIYGYYLYEAPKLIENVVQQKNEMMCIELAGYLEESFGNPTRIDYGTGHETTFMIFLCIF